MSRATTLEVGARFGRLVILARADRQGALWRWQCRCDCGTEKAVRGQHLRAGRVVSCGCLRREMSIASAQRMQQRHPKAATIHGGVGTLTYGSWANMRARVLCPGHDHYHYYGGRGITIDPAWNDFAAFLRDMGPRPSSAHSIDRINNDGNYEPGNCRWVTQREQRANRRDSRCHP